MQQKIVFIDGCRIPFLKSGTGYADTMAYELAAIPLVSLLNRNDLSVQDIDYIVMGNVIQEVKTSNCAREAALAAGFPHHIPAHTVTMACISANQALATGITMIRAGQARTVLAGGVETMSDVPIRLSRRLRKKLLASQKYRSPLEYLKLLKGFKLADLAPELPAIAEYSTGDTMGQSCDKLAAVFGVSRREQDAYAMLSHQRAHEAAAKGWLSHEVVPAVFPPNYEAITADNGIRGDTSLEKLETLKPAFIKPHGTVTAGNSSFLTDGASAVVVMAEEAALGRGYAPAAELVDFVFVAQDPGEELLLGPAYAITRLLDQSGLTLDDIGVIELHEAFAGQVLANLNALDSDGFAREKLGRALKVGEVDRDKLNRWGGSLSIGHPFGATGTRLVTTAVNRLRHENQEWALLAACAAGGLGHAMLIRNYQGS